MEEIDQYLSLLKYNTFTKTFTLSSFFLQFFIESFTIVFELVDPLSVPFKIVFEQQLLVFTSLQRYLQLENLLST